MYVHMYINHRYHFENYLTDICVICRFIAFISQTEGISRPLLKR